jgi:hypothetical protein
MGVSCLVTSGRSAVGGHLLLLTALAATAGAAGDEDSNCANKAENSGGENKPDADRPASSGRGVAVDSSSDDGEASKVTSQSNDGDDEGGDGNESRHERAKDTSTESQKERNEAKTSTDRVQNHDIGQGLCSASANFGQVGALESVGRVITDASA